MNAQSYDGLKAAVFDRVLSHCKKINDGSSENIKKILKLCQTVVKLLDISKTTSGFISNIRALNREEETHRILQEIIQEMEKKEMQKITQSPGSDPSRILQQLAKSPVK